MLTPSEYDLAEHIGVMQYQKWRRSGTPNTFIGRHSYECYIEGFAGEMAFCKLFNLYPHLDTEPVTVDDGDCNLFGLRIDVKTTNVPHGQLLATRGKKVESTDAFALLTGEKRKYTYRGLMASRELLREIRLRQMTTKGPYSYAASQDELKETITP